MIYRFSCAILLVIGFLFFAAGCGSKKESPANQQEEFLRLMNTGKNYLDQGEASKARAAFEKSIQLSPTDADAHLNLANAHLLEGNAEKAIAEAEEVLKLENNSAAAHFVKGSALLRLGRHEEALKSLQTCKNLDPLEPATAFQLGLAHFQLRHWDEAIAAFQEVIAAQPNHPSAHFQLSQALLRAGRNDEGQKALEAHQPIAAQNAGKTLGPATFEKSKFTQAKVPFRLEQPSRTGVAVRFSDQTQAVFGNNGQNYFGPIAVLDPDHTGWNSLFVMEKGQGFRLLWNTNGVFEPYDEPYPANPEANYTRMLVGDLQNDRFEDVIVLGDKGTHVFRFATNGYAMDVGPFSRLQNLKAIDGALVDLDFTGKLDLLAVTATNSVRLFRQFGPALFTDITSTSGIPNLLNVTAVIVDDWPRDEMMDVMVARSNTPPLLLAKERGGLLIPTNMPAWPAGSGIASGDLNNDLRTDLIVVSNRTLQVTFHGTNERKDLQSQDGNIRQVKLIDHDNDGWLDIWAFGDRISAWRNLGQAGFEPQNTAMGLDSIQGGPFASAEMADFDFDCDPDAVLVPVQGPLRFLRNEGGNANQQIKVRLLGNRSNASGLGVKVELSAGGLRLVRTVQSLPVEIGVGKNQQLDSIVTHWFNLAVPVVDVQVNCKEPFPAIEITLPEGSCPYLYAWDGKQYRFVTDVLGAAPAGLPVADGVIIQSDPDELVWVGNTENFQPKEGAFELQITEELREALYLDEVKLFVVDHPPGTEIHSLDKLVPGKPFPPTDLIALHNEHALLSAKTLAGVDVTHALTKADNRRVSPDKLRIPQQRGLAEPHGVVLDFGELPADRPLVLVLNGWLRFGGGMANINASHDPSLPFPFPGLEVETKDNHWEKVDVVVGAPAGKTKTIVVDLERKLPPGSRRLRLQTAFEIHWDRIALLEKARAPIRVIPLHATTADLHWRGFSQFEDLSWDWPLTPNYNRVTPNPYWRITPEGWCTRYGDVRELLERRDEGMVIMNGGDELTLRFDSKSIPALPRGTARDFLVYLDGWDKDSDFHVVTGTTIDPIPWHGMDDQQYGEVPRPKFPSDELHRKYNTRWVGHKTLRRAESGPSAKPGLDATEKRAF